MSLKQEGNTWIWQPVPKSPLRKMISCSFLPLLFLLFSIHFFYFGFNLWNVLPFLGLLFIYYTWSSTIICHESITLWEKLGFQLETQTGNGKTTRKFIPKENLVDVLIHEGIIGCKVIYALAFRLKDGSPLVIAFPHSQPTLKQILPMYHQALALQPVSGGD